MAFQSVPETAQAFVKGVVNNETVGMTFNFSKSGGYTESDLEDLAADVDDWFSTEMLPNLSDSFLYTETVVRGLENENDYEVTENAGSGYGGQTGSPLSNNVTFCAKRLSGLTGRDARGRVFITGLRALNLTSDTNTLSVASITAILTALLEIASYAVTHGWIEVIVSRWKDGVKRAEGTTKAVTTWSYTDSTVDSQRRRLH